MDNNLEIFSNGEFGDVRVVMTSGCPWFVGKDVLVNLGYSDLTHSILDHVDEDDRVNSKTQGVNDPELGQRGSWLINESGLYSLILSSKLPRAKQFKHWVTSEVLPSIRKTGIYASSKEPDKFELQKTEIMLLNARTEQAKLWKELASESTGTYREICKTYVANTLAGKEIFALPETTEKTYTATQVGELLGISANKVGKIANANSLKTEKYGKWYHDKSKFSSKEVDVFRYNDAGIEAIRAILDSNSPNKGKIIGYEEYVNKDGKTERIALVQK